MANRWTLEEIERLFKEYEGNADPSELKQRKRLRILDAATKRFIHHGYRKTSIEEIAQDAGVAKGTVYLYFKTKGDLILHAIIQEKRQFKAAGLQLFAADVAPRDRLLGIIKLSLVLTTQMPLIAKLLGGDREMAAALDDLPADVRRRSELDRLDFMSELVRAAAPPEMTASEVEERAKVILGMSFFGGLLAEPHLRQGLSIERYAELLASLIVDGLVGPHRTEARR